MSDFIDDFFDTESMISRYSGDVAFSPLADFFVKDNIMNIRVELPGVDPEDVSVTMKEGCLRISGERKRSSSEEDSSYHMEEMSYGCFCRSFCLPEGTDTEKIHANFDKGVLHVSIPLSESVKEKKIPIEGVSLQESKRTKSLEGSEKQPKEKKGSHSGEKYVKESTTA